MTQAVLDTQEYERNLSIDPEFFKSERKRLGHTFEWLATTLELNAFTFKKWANGSRKMPPEMGYALAALEAGLDPVVPQGTVSIPRSMGYIFAALQAGLEPIGRDHLVETKGKSEAA